MSLPWWIQYIAIPVVIGLLWLDFFIHRNAQVQQDKVIAEKNAEIEALHVRINSVAKEFYDYRVNSAQLYATVTAVSEVKRELLGAFSRMEDKLDRIVERNDRRDGR